MMFPRPFDGTEEVEVWIAHLNAHSAKKGLTVAQKLDLAFSLLSPAVNGCMRAISVAMENVTGKKWTWTWPKLDAALLAAATQVRYYTDKKNEKRNKAIVKGVVTAGVGIVAGVTLLPVVFTGILGVIGFSSGGVVAGSAAAAIQSSIGAVQAGSLFAFCQSAAAGGAAMATVGGVSAAVGGTAAALAANVANEKAWSDLEKEEPSHTWEDGDEFRPSQTLILVLLTRFG